MHGLATVKENLEDGKDKVMFEANIPNSLIMSAMADHTLSGQPAFQQTE